MALHLLVVDDLIQRALGLDFILEIDYTHGRHYDDDQGDCIVNVCSQK